MPKIPPRPAERFRARLPQDEANELRRLRTLFGFRSDYQFVQSAVRLFLRLLQRAEKMSIQTDEESIEEMFTHLEEWEAPEYGRRSRGKDSYLVEQLFGQDREEIGARENVLEDDLSHVRRAEVDKWLDRFTARHYDALYRYFSHLAPPPSSDGSEPLDIFHDTLLRLRFPPDELTDYASFERYALGKFHHRHT